ncbi:hypothetical protein GH714_022135 [Hevea brasiliensis]|uniref:EGF-like domain-containing protein n=1 Tax=Hevea brasiliensis TaxID=3981 RepID=A0A6A6KT85_HEVBR|nr:hypothetical protein GH714_022135 [Hevea brasiliensis]
MSTCDSFDSVYNKSCAGSGCCQMEIPDGLYYTNVTAYSFDSHKKVQEFNPCTYAFVVEDDKFDFSSEYLKNIPEDTEFTMVLEWSIDNSTLSTLCKDNAESYQPDNVSGYRCRCKKGYEGNPYLGCRGVGIGFIVLFVASSWLSLGLKQRKLIKLKEKFFRENGGFILRQKFSGQQGNPDMAKIFTDEELKKATNNYDESTIVGKGGFGMMKMHPWVAVNTEETEFLLAREESSAFGDGDGYTASSAGIDSMKDHLTVPMVVADEFNCTWKYQTETIA